MASLVNFTEYSKANTNLLKLFQKKKQKTKKKNRKLEKSYKLVL